MIQSQPKENLRAVLLRAEVCPQAVEQHCSAFYCAAGHPSTRICAGSGRHKVEPTDALRRHAEMAAQPQRGARR
jgi:hypothetical protein